MHVGAAAAVVGDVCVQQFCERVLVLFYWLIFYGRQWRRCYALYHNKQNVLLRFLTGYRVLWKHRFDRGSCAQRSNGTATAAAIIIVFNNSVIILFVWCIVFDLNVQSVSVNNATGHSSALAPCIHPSRAQTDSRCNFFFALVWIFSQNPHLKSFTHTCMHSRRQNGFIFSVVDERVFVSTAKNRDMPLAINFIADFGNKPILLPLERTHRPLATRDAIFGFHTLFYNMQASVLAFPSIHYLCSALFFGFVCHKVNANKNFN